MPAILMLPGSGPQGPEEMMPASATSDGKEHSIFQQLAAPFVESGFHVLQLGKPGIEFFSTFGGSTLSCRIGREVLDIVDDEGLQENAKTMGERLIKGLKDLEQRYDSVGDVRGMGLFIGLELITPDGSEATGICAYVKNRMRDHRILIGSEGPKDNILKIRPPLTIEAADVDMIVEVLDKILAEVTAWTT